MFVFVFVIVLRKCLRNGDEIGRALGNNGTERKMMRRRLTKIG